MLTVTLCFQEAAIGATVSVAADEPGADGKRTLNAIWLDGTNILHQEPTIPAIPSLAPAELGNFCSGSSGSFLRKRW